MEPGAGILPVFNQNTIHRNKPIPHLKGEVQYFHFKQIAVEANSEIGRHRYLYYVIHNKVKKQ
jgi:hypothetical protein